jgi:hypothetical protein
VAAAAAAAACAVRIAAAFQQLQLLSELLWNLLSGSLMVFLL